MSESRTKLIDFKQWDKTLEEAGKIKTNIPVSEFNSRFAILFTDQVKKLPYDEVMAISKEWENRINKFKPINIIDDKTGEVLRTLPPMYNRLKIRS